MCGVLSAECIARNKVAIYVCNHAELKRDILCAPGSENDAVDIPRNKVYRKQRWNEIIDRKAPVILRNLGLPKTMHGMVISTVFLVGKRMLTWAEYHERALSFLREYSVNFLNSSFFTPLGVINNKKAAEKLINDENLSIKQKYKLACLYCFRDHISTISKKMSQDEWGIFYNAQNPNTIRQPMIIKYWSYYLKRDIDKLKGDKSFEQYLLELVVNSGIQAAVEYYLERPNMNNPNAIVAAAVETVKYSRSIYDDWLGFHGERYYNREFSWVPNEYNADILYFLFSRMSEDEKNEFMKEVIRSDYVDVTQNERRYRALEYFLNWPYQKSLLELAKLMPENSPEGCYTFLEDEYSDILLSICDRIESTYECLHYRENKICNYRELLKDFWIQSPESYKRYIFNDAKKVFKKKKILQMNFKWVVHVLIKLIQLKGFIPVDKKIINMILGYATDDQKEQIMYSAEWRSFCIDLIKRQEWEILHNFELIGFLSEEKTDKFKRELSFTKEAQRFLIHFAVCGKWNAVHSFIRWSALSDEVVNYLKKETIHSQDGMKACVNIILGNKNVEQFDNFVRWFLPSDEEINAFKKNLVLNSEEFFLCVKLIYEHRLERFNEFINFCLSSEEDIKLLKKNIADTCGIYVCESLISGTFNVGYNNSYATKFDGAKWEEVDEFLTWCFSSEEERNDFKKNKFFEKFGQEIQLKFITTNQWEAAEKFSAWVGLSDAEIEEVKKETLFNYSPSVEFFRGHMLLEICECGTEQEALNLFCKWYLTDKETALEFKHKYKSWFIWGWSEKKEIMFKKFDTAIAERLIDIEKENLE